MKVDIIQSLITMATFMLAQATTFTSADKENSIVNENPISWSIQKIVQHLQAKSEGSFSDGVDLISMHNPPHNIVRKPVKSPFNLTPFKSKIVADKATRDVGMFPQVQTKQGILIGRSLTYSHAFYSVPYAEAPIGEKRFHDPVEVKEFDPLLDDVPTLDLSEPDYRICYQLNDCEEKYSCQMTEDCLVLNIHVPVKVDLANLENSEKLPVMVWIHGGFFFHGAGTDPGTDGEMLANSTQFIIVGVNYRVGSLGFMAVEDKDGTRHFNQGLKDQQAALKWVQKNIGSFGGDKNKVTVFGESAGAQSVMFHLISSVSKPLFNRGIMQSNPAAFQYETYEQSVESITKRTLTLLDCQTDDFECLWSVDPMVLSETRNTLMVQALLSGEFFNGIEPYRPIIDNIEYTDQPHQQFKRGEWSTEKPVIIGTNEDEMSYVSAVLEPISVPFVLFQTLNRLVIGEDALDEVVDMYTPLATGRPKDYTEALAIEVTDMIFACPSRALARYAAETTQSDVFSYVNGHAMNDPGCSEGFGFEKVCNTSFHSSEIPIVFNGEKNYNMTFSNDDKLMALMFDDYWASFSENGTPSPSTKSLGDFENWPSYVPGEWKQIWLATSQRTEVNYREDYCDLWDRTGFYLKVSDDKETTTTDKTTTDTTTVQVTETVPMPLTTTQNLKTTTQPVVITTTNMDDVDDNDENGNGAATRPHSLSITTLFVSFVLSYTVFG